MRLLFGTLRPVRGRRSASSADCGGLGNGYENSHPQSNLLPRPCFDRATRHRSRGRACPAAARCRGGIEQAGYDNPAKSFPRNETWNGVSIIRLLCTGFGKRTKWARACDFGSYFVSCFLTLLQLPRFDVVIAMTSPPLISLLAAWFVWMKGGRLVFWVMDLNPDEAIAAGWLAEGSWPARYLKRALHHSLSAAERIVVMDRFMRERILGKGVPGCKMDVIPPWSHDRAVRYDHDGREAFARNMVWQGSL